MHARTDTDTDTDTCTHTHTPDAYTHKEEVLPAAILQCQTQRTSDQHRPPVAEEGGREGRQLTTQGMLTAGEGGHVQCQWRNNVTLSDLVT